MLPADATGDVLPRLLEASATLAESMADTVVIDDAQWIDPATARFAMLLARRARARLVVAYRPGQLNADAASLVAALRDEVGSTAQVVLRPLTAEGLGDLVAAPPACASERAREPAEWLMRRCSGNPFFALEVLRCDRGVRAADSSTARAGKQCWRSRPGTTHRARCRRGSPT